jgi:hypothetical protein
MGVLNRLRRWIARGDSGRQALSSAEDSDRESRAVRDSGGSRKNEADTSRNNETTTIEDAAATSLRAIKLTDSEREALDAENRDP